MTEPGTNFSLLILSGGALIVFAILVKSVLERMSIPPLLGYITLGSLLRPADAKLGFRSKGVIEVFGFPATCLFPPILVRSPLRKWPR